jgi:hypothetical protein
MQLAQLRMKSLANDLTTPHDNGSNKRIWTDFPTPMLSKLQSPLQVHPIRGCQLRVHATD